MGLERRGAGEAHASLLSARPCSLPQDIQALLLSQVTASCQLVGGVTILLHFQGCLRSLGSLSCLRCGPCFGLEQRGGALGRSVSRCVVSVEPTSAACVTGTETTSPVGRPLSVARSPQSAGAKPDARATVGSVPCPA